jgi:tRNA A37 methylthiotransferase MiaB
MDVRRERTSRLRALSERLTRRFHERQTGRTLSVVTLGGTRALSSNYVPVELASPEPAQSILDHVYRPAPFAVLAKS